MILHILTEDSGMLLLVSSDAVHVRQSQQPGDAISEIDVNIDRAIARTVEQTAEVSTVVGSTRDALVEHSEYGFGVSVTHEIVDGKLIATTWSDDGEAQKKYRIEITAEEMS